MANFSKQHIKGIIEQQNINQNKFLRMKGIVGTGIGYKITKGMQTEELCVRVYVEKKLPLWEIRKEDIVPELLGGKQIKTDVIEVGKIQAPPPMKKKSSIWERFFQILSVDRLKKYRPVFPGISVGNKKITAGTIGAVCNWAGKKVLLSNAHVFCEDPFKGISETMGDISDYVEGIVPQQETEIWQQGPYDGGNSECRIGKLRKMVLIRQDKPNYTDSAMCELDTGIEADPKIAELDYIPTGIIPWNPFDTSLLGTQVIKSGRTTGITRGTITDINATINVDYGGKSATFKEQILTTDMSEGGDSGSLVLKESDRKAVALLFAGSPTVTVMIPIEHAISPMGMELITETLVPGKEFIVNFILQKESNDKWTVKGQVTNAENASLEATLNLDNLKIVKADKQGNFAFSEIEKGKHNMLCEMAGYLSQTKEFEII